MYKCKFCQHIFVSQYNLNTHLKSAKFCLSKRENIQLEQEQQCFECEFCKKKFTIKSNYNKHTLSCKEKQKNHVNELNEQIKSQSNSIKEIKETYKNLMKEQTNNEIKKYKNIIESQKLQIDGLKNNIIDLEKKLVESNVTIKLLNNNIKDSKYDFEKILAKYHDAKRIIYNNTNNYIGIDFSQKFFDTFINQKYSYDYYVEGQKGAKKLFINFLYRDDDIKEVIVSDNSRDKIKVTDIFGNSTTINFEQLSSLCKESKSLSELLEKYSKEFFKRPDNDPFNTLTEQVTKRNKMFKKKNLRILYNEVKAHINTENNTLNMITENQLRDRQLNEDNEEKKESII